MDAIEFIIEMYKQRLENEFPRNFKETIYASQRTEKQSEQERNELLFKMSSLIQVFQNFFNNQIFIIERNNWCNVEFDRKKGIYLKEEISVFNCITSIKQARILNLLTKIFELIKNNASATKRDLFYQDKTVYVDQRRLDDAIEDICCIMNANRYDLHIRSTTKGLIYGKVIIQTITDTIDCNLSRNGLSIPNNIQEISNISSNAKFILVIEKDSTFQRLIDSDFASKQIETILITGKGFPDLNTRELVKLLWEYLRIPIFVLVDANPHGIEIFTIYKYGSLNMAHTCSTSATPQVAWLGIHPSDMIQFNIPDFQRYQLTNNDRKKLQDLLTRSYIQNDEKLFKELIILDQIGMKTEIQSLVYHGINYLADVYLIRKIMSEKWI